MIRRPLQRPFEVFNARGAAVRPKGGLLPYIVLAPKSPFVFKNLEAIADRIGLPVLPHSKKVLSAVLPDQNGEHFLQTGWATDNTRQAAFEMGNARMIISLHFRKKQRASHWHLDMAEIDDGKSSTLSLACGDRKHAPRIVSVFQTVNSAMTQLNLGNWRGAETVLDDRLQPIIRDLDTISEIESAVHEELYMKGLAESGHPQSVLRV